MVERKGLQKITRFDGRLHLFQRPMTPFIWAGFHHKGRYVRTSTKQTDFGAAVPVAEQWYTLKQAEILTGASSVAGRSFVAAAKAAVKAMRGRADRGERSQQYVDGIEENLNRRLIPYFGSTAVTSIGIVEWEKFKEDCYAKSPNLSRATMHQFKTALRTVLNECLRQGWIKTLPVFKDIYDKDRIKTPRTWFDPKEYQRLLAAIRRHRKTLLDTRWVSDVDELYDYVIFVANSGLRVGEARNVRFCDITVHSETIDGQARKYLVIGNIRGKRGTGDCRTMDGAVDAFERRCEARGVRDPAKCRDSLFAAYHRDMFNAILGDADLKWSKEQPPRKRDLTVLRHTYISFRILNGVSVYEIATNCRTSAQMISEHYAKWLSPRMMKGLNRLARHAADAD
jgi:integrase